MKQGRYKAWTVVELAALSHLIKSGKAAGGALFDHAERYDRSHASVRSMSHKLHKTGTWQHWIKVNTQPGPPMTLNTPT